MIEFIGDNATGLIGLMSAAIIGWFAWSNRRTDDGALMRKQLLEFNSRATARLEALENRSRAQVEEFAAYRAGMKAEIARMRRRVRSLEDEVNQLLAEQGHPPKYPQIEGDDDA